MSRFYILLRAFRRSIKLEGSEGIKLGRRGQSGGEL